MKFPRLVVISIINQVRVFKEAFWTIQNSHPLPLPHVFPTLPEYGRVFYDRDNLCTGYKPSTHMARGLDHLGNREEAIRLAMALQ